MHPIPSDAQAFVLRPSHMRRLINALTPLAVDGWDIRLFVNWCGDGTGRRWTTGYFTAQATKLMVKSLADHQLAGLILKLEADSLDEACEVISATTSSMKTAFYKSLEDLS